MSQILFEMMKLPRFPGLICLPFLVCLLVSGHAKVAPDKVSAEMRLIQDMFEGYDNMSRPRVNSSEVVEVTVGLHLIILRDMNEQQQVLKTYIWADMAWSDDYLHWDPLDYDNITQVVVPQSKVWLPDAAIENSAGGIYGDAYDSKIRIRVLSNGHVWYAPSGQVETTCNVNLRYFPFDIQSCKIVFSNWIYTGSQVVLINGTPSVGLGNFEKNGQWEVEDTLMTSESYVFEGVLYPTVTATLTLRRKPLFYLIYVALPCILLSGLSLLVFWIPPDAGERISLGITVLLSFSVFQLLLLEKMPDSSDYIPILGIYLMMVMFNTSLSLVLSIVILNVYYCAGTHAPVPHWARRVIMGWMAYLMCMQREPGKIKTKKKRRMSLSMMNSFSSSVSVMWANERSADKGHNSNAEPVGSASQGKRNSEANGTLVPRGSIADLSSSMIEQDTDKDWKFMGEVLDKFFFTFVVTMDLLMSLSCMVVIPMIKSTVEAAKSA